MIPCQEEVGRNGVGDRRTEGDRRMEPERRAGERRIDTERRSGERQRIQAAYLLSKNPKDKEGNAELLEAIKKLINCIHPIRIYSIDELAKTRYVKFLFVIEGDWSNHQTTIDGSGVHFHEFPEDGDYHKVATITDQIRDKYLELSRNTHTTSVV